MATHQQQQQQQQPQFLQHASGAGGGGDARNAFCFLTGPEQEELERMKSFHLSMSPFFTSVPANQQVFIDSLFSLLLKVGFARVRACVRLCAGLCMCALCERKMCVVLV